MILVRKLWLQIHLYLGLTAGLVFALSGITGSLIVFEHDLDEHLNETQMITVSVGQQQPIGKIVEAAATAYPDLGTAAHVHMPHEAGSVARVRFKGDAKRGIAAEVFVDPVTLQVTGKRQPEWSFMAITHQLHANLLGGKVGSTIMGILGLLMLLSVISGVVLWWPLLTSGLRNALAVRRGKRVYDLHKTIGGVSTIFLTLICATGAIIVFAPQLRPLANLISPVTKIPTKVEAKPPTSTNQKRLTAEEAIAIARREMPNCRIMSIELPQGPQGTYKVFARQEGEIGQTHGVGRVWVDPYGGEVLATRDWRRHTASDVFFRIQVALHSGDAFGIVGRGLFFLVGFAPAGLYVTGFILWWRKKVRKLSNG